MLPAVKLSNPLEHPQSTAFFQPLSSTETVSARTVYHETQAAIKPLISGVRTQEQLDSLLDHIQIIR